MIPAPLPIPRSNRGERQLAAVFMRRARRTLGHPRRRSIQHVRVTAAAIMRRCAREEWPHDAFAVSFLGAIATILETAPYWVRTSPLTAWEAAELATDGRVRG